MSAKQKELFQKEDVNAIYPEYYVIKINNFDDVARDNLDDRGGGPLDLLFQK